jgi:CubicO group peptidase (beta-lactamase class C family)
MVMMTDIERKIKRVENGLEPDTEGREVSNLETKNLYERMEHFNVPGVSIAVINDGNVEWERGYGLLENEKDLPVTPNSIFHACSMSKFVTAMTVLALVQEEMLALDELVNQKLTTYKIPKNEFTKTGVTLRHLLSHQAGIIDHDDSFGVYQAEDPVPGLLDILQGNTKYNPKPVQVECVPGSKFAYSDAGYCVIEQLLLDVTGQPFGELVKELIFEPLGMRNSCFQHAFSFVDTSHIAVGHNQYGAVVDGKRATYPYLAAAGLWSTPTDLGLLIVELYALLQGNGKLHISPSLAQDMLTPQGCAEWAGLGVFREGQGTQTRITSLGWGVGFQCMLAAYPYFGAGVVVMTNSEPGCHQEKALTGEMVRSVEREYGWKAT